MRTWKVINVLTLAASIQFMPQPIATKFAERFGTVRSLLLSAARSVLIPSLRARYVHGQPKAFTGGHHGRRRLRDELISLQEKVAELQNARREVIPLLNSACTRSCRISVSIVFQIIANGKNDADVRLELRGRTLNHIVMHMPSRL